MTGLGLIEVQSGDEDPVPVRSRWSEYVLYLGGTVWWQKIGRGIRDLRGRIP